MSTTRRPLALLAACTVIVLLLFGYEALNPASVVRAAVARAGLPESPPVLIHVEADAQAFEDGVRSLALATLLDDAQARKCFAPVAKTLGIDPDDPVESLLAQAGWNRLFLDSAVLDVFSVTFQGDVVVRPGETVPAAVLASHRWVDAEFILTVRPGPVLRDFLRLRLEQGVFEEVEIGGRTLVHTRGWEYDWVQGGVYFDRVGTSWTSASEYLEDARWVIGTDPEFVARRAAAGPSENDPWAERRALVAGGACALFLDVGLDLPPIPGLPVGTAESVRGLSLGLSFPCGGVRESVALRLSDEPRGLLQLLDALSPGLRAPALAPRDTPYLLTVGVDVRAALALPLAAPLIALPDVVDLVATCADEVALISFQPSEPPYAPEAVIRLDLRDEERFRELVNERAPSWGSALGLEVERATLLEGTECLKFRGPLPVEPVLAVHAGHAFLATGLPLLRTAVTEWGTAGRASLATGSPAFDRAMIALNGGRTDRLCVLAWADVASTLPIGVQLMIHDPPGGLDLGALPDTTKIAEHLRPIAAGLRREEGAVVLDAWTPTGVGGFFLAASLYRSMAGEEDD